MIVRAPFKRKIQSLLCIGFLTTAPALAASIGDGVTAFHQGQYESAFEILRPLADAGNAEALTIIGHMHRAGLGVTEDPYEAFRCYIKAAKQGHTEAEFQVGTMYLEGTGVTEDEDEATNWLSKAALAGHETAIVVRDALFAGDFSIGC